MKLKPFRNPVIVGVVAQILFLLIVASAAGLLYRNMLRGLDALGLSVDLGFLDVEAGFGISEGIPYTAEDSYGRAFWVGAVNTIRVSVIAIVVATVIGLVIGISRLSSNWLVRNVATGFVELFRNIPLLLQILFWYSAVILSLPGVRESISVLDRMFISQRGIYVPRPIWQPGAWIFLVLGLIGIGAGIAAAVIRTRAERHDGAVRYPLLTGLGIFVAALIAGWIIAPGRPVVFEVPVLERFNFAGGLNLSPEYAALMLGLSIYTSSFIAEVVRGAIQAVDRGQREAARAIGLTESRVTRLVVLPQALRVIVPPLTSQYLNLAKNSSLAIAIGYPDLFNIGNTMMNQTGQSIPVFGLIMASYLVISLVTSALMNWYNRAVRLAER